MSPHSYPWGPWPGGAGARRPASSGSAISQRTGWYEGGFSGWVRNDRFHPQQFACRPNTFVRRLTLSSGTRGGHGVTLPVADPPVAQISIPFLKFTIPAVSRGTWRAELGR